jgi:pre-mRNA-splicing helicase BRR2
VETVFDILDLEDEDRTRLLAFPAEQLSDIALFCNAYPNIELDFEVEGETPEGAEEEEGVVHREFTAGQSVSMRVQLSRELDEDEEEDAEYINGLGKVVAARYDTNSQPFSTASPLSHAL